MIYNYQLIRRDMVIGHNIPVAYLKYNLIHLIYNSILLNL